MKNLYILAIILFVTLSGIYSESNILLSKVVMLSATAEDFTINLYWNDPSDTDASHISITWTDGTIEESVEVDTGIGNYSITGLTNDTEYRITLQAMNTAGDASNESAFSITPTSTYTVYRFIYTADDLNAVRGGVPGYEDWTLSGSYILMANIDLADYDSGDGSGWSSIGTGTNMFNGRFDGNNHVIRNLYINRLVQYQGLFAHIGTEGIVMRLGLEDISISGQMTTGGLAGRNYGIIKNCYATGSLSGISTIGGLVGLNVGGGRIYHSYANVNVSSNYDSFSRSIGGLVGENSMDSIIENCYAAGEVTSIGLYHSVTGGLVGKNDVRSIVKDSYAIGSVSGHDHIGGLVGSNDRGSIVDDCYAIGGVSGYSTVGGLIGSNVNDSTVKNSHATGSVRGSSHKMGGLIGANYSMVEACYATGNVSAGGGSIGGLVGINYSTGIISGSYATGAVQGGLGYIGGLVGKNNAGTIENCYSSGSVCGERCEYIGNLVGENDNGSVINCYAYGCICDDCE